MSEVDFVKCACPNCVCVIAPAKAVEHDGSLYCCDGCARGHAAGAGCAHAGCGCQG